MKKLINHPLFSGSAVMVGGSLIANGINYLYHLIMGRMLGPASYGILASIFSVLYMVSVVPMSTNFAIVKFISSAKDKKERIAIYKSLKDLVMKVAIGISILVFLFSPQIANFLKIEQISNIRLIFIIVFFSLMTLVNQASSQGRLNFFGVVVPMIISSLTKFLFGVVFVIIGLSVGGAVFGIVLASIFAYIISLRYVKKFKERVVNNKFDTKPFLKFAFPVLMQALAFTSIFTVDLILVKHFFPPFEAGLYAALSTLGKIVYFAAQPITQVMFPIVSGRRAKGGGYKKVYYLSLVATLSISSIIVLFYYLFPNIAIGLLYGEAYLQATKELVWMGAFIGIYSICYNLTNFLLSIDRTKIVIFPILATIVQIVGIYKFHSSLLEVIKVSLFSMIFLLFGLTLYLGYNQFQRIYAKK